LDHEAGCNHESTAGYPENMSNVEAHYEQLLAEHYTWMLGITFEEKVAEQKALLNRVIATLPQARWSGTAIDLGSGPGFQSIALAELGYSPVIAIDSSQRLLAELHARKGTCTIETREADITRLDRVPMLEDASVVVCMGDTLTHLPDKSSVQKLFMDVFQRLARGGAFVLTYRDLTAELTGIDRFLPIQADDTRIMTCFLEYTDSDTVMVHDLVHVRDQGLWTLHKSSYQKLRLASSWVRDALLETGFSRTWESPAGRLLMLVAQK
jgi:SAM-dependent methyltransferase